MATTRREFSRTAALGVGAAMLSAGPAAAQGKKRKWNLRYAPRLDFLKPRPIPFSYRTRARLNAALSSSGGISIWVGSSSSWGGGALFRASSSATRASAAWR